jgi:hypothetical protein
MSVDTTDTRFIPPAELTEKALDTLNRDARDLVRDALTAETATLEVEDARPLVRPEYRARHRAAELPEPVVGPEPWNPNPPFFPGEETKDLSAQTAVLVPLERRERGAALAAAQSRSRVAWLQTAMMRTQQKFRAAGFIRGGEQ